MSNRLFLKISLVTVPVLLSAACGASRESRSLRDLSRTLDATSSVDDYQIGEGWAKTPVTQSMIDSGTPAFKRAALATAKVSVMFGSATAFVIGEKNGQVLFATNHHVIEDQSTCAQSKISFEFLKIKNLRCAQVVTTNTDLDLTIFTVSGLDDASRTTLLGVARSFTTAAPVKGTKLLTVGYGIASNPGGALMAGADDDCKTFSPDGETRYMPDPDELNPGPYETWMFATGCDVSHGDSGSALVDRATGNVVGILSTGKIPKNPRVRDAKYLADIFNSSSEDVWKELTYVVPASKITEMVGDILP